MCFAPQRRALFRHLNFQQWSELLTCTFSTSQLPRVVRAWCVLFILSWTHASRHNGVHFFDISTSKSGPILVCFCTFWLGNVLRATTACNFSSLIWPAGSAPAALASLLFDPPEPQIIETTHCFATFLFRAPGSSLFWDFLFFVVLSSSLLFPHSSHLCFPSVHIVGSLTSKLPSPTSSTAQGGGGSFKNRKPIGEVGCCDSGMAERSHWWTERCLRSPLFLSLSLTMYPPTYLSIYVSIYLSIYLSLSLSSNYLSIYLSLSFICLSV